MSVASWVVGHTWDGEPLPAWERAVVLATDEGAVLRLHVVAPLHGDPPPPGPPGPTPGLWNHEVVEWFVAGSDARYLEVELGPHGHHLVLRLDGVRNPVETALPMHVTTRRCGTAWWTGTADVPRAWLPPGPWRANAYRLAGTGPGRRYLAATPLPGPQPDFHQPARFAPCALPEGPATLRDLVVAAVTALHGVDDAEATRRTDDARQHGAPEAFGPWVVATLRAREMDPTIGDAARDDIG